ncbi:AAA family ATPase [Myxococcus sp. AM001]|nr:AAA family ATPase [Myxococcus sp. AM001]
MRLAQVTIRNFKSIKDISLKIPRRSSSRNGSADFVSIVGENNAGKSSILNAILFALSGNSKATLEDFPGLDASASGLAAAPEGSFAPASFTLATLLS